MASTASEQIYRERINRVIDHINECYADALPLETLARIAFFSPFHFHRVFRSLVGEPVHVYVRRVRLERAVQEMLYGSKATLTAIALRCGFASSSDFSRAFKQAYGFNPRQCSREKMLEDSKIRQDLRANAGYGFGALPSGKNPDRFRVRLVDLPVRRIAYVRVLGCTGIKSILDAYQSLMEWGRKAGVLPGADLMGMSPDNPDITPMKKVRFDWCLTLPPHVKVGGGMNEGVLPANTFAMVRSNGDLKKEDRAWNWLFYEWLPKSGYQPADALGMELYRRTPEQIGWETFDLDCCLPVKSLAQRGRRQRKKA